MAKLNDPFPIQRQEVLSADGRPVIPIRYIPATTIPWWLAEIAYAEYVKHGGRGQSLERLAERGGFGPYELLYFLRGAEWAHDKWVINGSPPNQS